MKIKQVMITLFVFLSAIPITLVGILNMYYTNAKMETVLENDLKNAVSTQMKAIENFLSERRADAELLTRYQLINELLQYEKNQDIVNERLFRPYVENMLSLEVDCSDFIESITVLNLDFKIIASSEPNVYGQSSNLKDVDPKYLSGSLQFTPVIETPRPGDRSRIIAGIEQVMVDGKPAGYLAMELNLSFFEEIRSSARLFNNGTIYLIDGQGNLIAAGDTIASRNSYVLSREERKDFSRAWEERDKNSHEGVLKYTAEGDHLLSYYREFENIDWKMISSVNVDQVLKTRENYVRLILIMIIILGILLMAVNCIMARYLKEPIEDMITKFHQIKETKDYSIRMTSIAKSEIGVISDEINLLLTDIENYIQMEKQVQEHLKAKAEHDPLTNLYNKRAIDQLMNLELERAVLDHKKIACLFLDVDNFKDFNTSYGHNGGDQVLLFIANALSALPNTIAGRLGGDEFVACITRITSVEDTKRDIEALLEKINKGIFPEDSDETIPIHCSIGVAFSDGRKISCDELIACADEAMYQVKNEHKNGYKIWEQT